MQLAKAKQRDSPVLCGYEKPDICITQMQLVVCDLYLYLITRWWKKTDLIHYLQYPEYAILEDSEFCCTFSTHCVDCSAVQGCVWYRGCHAESARLGSDAGKWEEKGANSRGKLCREDAWSRCK